MRTRIRGRYVVGYDADLNSHRLIDGGEVVFEDDRILYVGDQPYGEPVDREIDARQSLVIPGLIDIHALMDVGIHLLLTDRPRDAGYRSKAFVEGDEDVFTPEQTRKGAEATFALLLRSGVTTFCGMTAMVFKRWHDPDWEPSVYAEVADRSGLRAYLSHAFRAGLPYVEADGSIRWIWDERKGFEGLERNIAFVEDAEAGAFGERVHGLLFPYSADGQTPALLRATREAANQLGVGMRTHFAQSLAERDATIERFGRSPVEHLHDLGVLGPDVLLTHCLYGRGHDGGEGLSDAELALLADAGASVANTPWIYTWRGGYLDAFGRYRRAGVNMCIGTDTYPNDMLREMQYAAVMGTVAEADPTATTAADVFDAATLNAAKYLGRDDLGRLAPGAKADIVLVRTDRLTFAPTLDPIRSLVYYAGLRDVDTVIVDGKVVLEDGRVAGQDESVLTKQAEELLDDIGRTFQSWDPEQRPYSERFGPSYPWKKR